MKESLCKSCGKAFRPLHKNRLQLCCSRVCAGQLIRAQNAAKRQTKLCACGCGGVITKGRWDSWVDYDRHRYIGDHFRGRPDVTEKMSAGVREAYKNGRYASRPKSVKPKPAKWLSEEHLKKIRPTLLNGPQNLTKEQQARRNQNISRAKRGKPHTGRMARHNTKHPCAKVWAVRSPMGEYFTFSNLRAWCYQNEERFFDHKPDSKGPLWLRASAGIGALGGSRGDSCSWCGWTLVSKEQYENLVFGTPLASTQ